MTRELAEWKDAVAGRADPADSPVLRLAAPHDQDKGGGSRPFIGVDHEGHRWYVKPLNNGQTPRVTINEFIVGALGRLVGAPVCETAVVRIPDDLDGQEYFNGRKLEAGYAHGCRELPGADVVRELVHRGKDENAVRHAGAYALHDWCWCGDPQWLYDPNDDMRLHSHDHGHYFPGGPGWATPSLLEHVDEPHAHATDLEGMDQAEVLRFADALDGLELDEIAQVMRAVPASWPVSDAELEAVGFFLYRRAPAVAGRLRGVE